MKITGFLETWMRSQKKESLSLCLPEGQDRRIQEASKVLSEFSAIKDILLFGLDKVEAEFSSEKICCHADPILKFQSQWDLLLSQRLAAAKPIDQASLSETDKNLLLAGSLLKNGEVHAVVAGSQATTGQVIRAGLTSVGMQAGIKRVSGAFIMIPSQLVARETKINYPFIFSDSAVNISPSAEDLTGIALSAAELHEAMGFGPAKLAFLSFSSRGSAPSPEQAKVRAAAELFAQKYPQYASDGELQLDAAIVPDVMQRKCPDSPLQGQANCLIFPNLDVGNICYKLAQRLAGMTAIGPILLGLDKPYCDLSRGALVEDIVSACIVSLMRSRKE